MPTAKRCDAATRRPEAYATLLGKLLAAAIIVTPLLAMSFPELNQRSGNSATSRRRGAESCGAAVRAADGGAAAARPRSGGRPLEEARRRRRKSPLGGPQGATDEPGFLHPIFA